VNAPELPWPPCCEPIRARYFTDRGVAAVILLHGPSCDLPRAKREPLVFHSGRIKLEELGRPVPRRRRTRAA
jgi:hypothetical protein